MINHQIRVASAQIQPWGENSGLELGMENPSCDGVKSLEEREGILGCNINQQLSQEEDEMELETELLELDRPSKTCLDLDPELEMKTTPRPQPQLQAKLDVESSLRSYQEVPEPQADRTESLHASLEELRQQDINPWNMRSNSIYLRPAEEVRVPSNHHSIRVQTSKHLFWADKLIQTSQESLERAISMHFDEKSISETSSDSNQAWVPEDTVSSKEQLQTQSSQSVVPATKPEQPLSHTPPPELSPAIDLAELVNLATSLAMASSNKPAMEPATEPTTVPAMEPPTEPPTEPVVDGAAQPAADQTEQEKFTQALVEKPLEDRMPQRAWMQESKNILYPYFDFKKPGVMRATFEGKVKFLHPPDMFPPSQETKPEPPQKPQTLLTRDPAEEQANRTRARGLQQCTALIQRGPAAAMATKAAQTFQRARASKSLEVQSGAGTKSQSSADENLLPLTTRQLAAFQDVFKLLSSGPTSTVDMKAALQNVGVQLSPQKMCEELWLADSDGDGIVSFRDFLGVLTDSLHLALCLVQVRTGRDSDPQALQTLFLEMVFKLMSQGFVPSKSGQELLLQETADSAAEHRLEGPGLRPQPHCGHSQGPCLLLPGHSPQRPLQSRAGPCSPYSQIPILAEKTWPERRTRNRAPRPEVRFPKSYQPSLGGPAPAVASPR
ncbi:Spermatogenesis-associated protein 32 [Galemys pyrenaicus]|uniref:Spermatogenesis-associated protein 32 n=1 Tax=Galemys pyrenaicus TaxID=202257 RepID=A0A8J6DDU4_GALPY|nr:Spermatogenesis-associated protein 32 [Galemys pyrenaicus]